MSEERPLVTFALFAYNQERYIRAAVEAALSQDYPKLEVILSDDSSSDSTYAMMCDLASRYVGSHKIRLNQNQKNLGIAGHLNVLMGMVNTDFVVIAAGDDISETHRTAELVRAWVGSGREAVSIHSIARVIDANGEDTGQFHQGYADELLSNVGQHATNNLWVLGATHAWDMSLFQKFQPLLSSVINEDVVIPARAALIGRVQLVAKPLVRYRAGIGISHEAVRDRAAGLPDRSISQLKRPYYLFLQKYRDYREMGVLDRYREDLARSRASSLYPIWLRRRHRTMAQLTFFLRRCRSRHLLREFLAHKCPRLLALKQKLPHLRGFRRAVPRPDR